MKITVQNAERGLQGMLLIDCIVYVAMYFLIIALSFTAFYSCWDNAREFRRTTDSIARTIRIGEAWRADVRTATGELRIEDSETKHILHIPQKGGEIEYGFFDGSVWRRAGETAEWTEVLPKVKVCHMDSEKRHAVSAWKWELELSTKARKSTVLPLFTFEAVPQPEGSH